jgi:glycosyltransferase involved in cell wall biosynthesis
MHWVVAAPFITDPSKERWLTELVPPDKHQFKVVVAPTRTGMFHHRSSKITDLAEWRTIWQHAGHTVAAAHEQGGIITLFPQLAAAVGMRQRYRGHHHPHVAWSFNLGHMYAGLKGALASHAMAKVDRFVVHSRREIEQYSTWLGLPRERFEFVPIQRPFIAPTMSEDRDQPFVLAMGSAARDYPTFIEAMRKLNLRTVIVTASHAIDGLQLPPNVTLKSKLNADECRDLAQMARLNVVPIANNHTASGQVTVVEAMTLGKPVIATRCIGTEDYILPEKTGVLVEPQSVDSLAAAIDRLWRDEPKRAELSHSARDYARTHFSDEAVAAELTRILDALIR